MVVLGGVTRKTSSSIHLKTSTLCISTTSRISSISSSRGLLKVISKMRRRARVPPQTTKSKTLPSSYWRSIIRLELSSLSNLATRRTTSVAFRSSGQPTWIGKRSKTNCIRALCQPKLQFKEPRTERCHLLQSSINFRIDPQNPALLSKEDHKPDYLQFIRSMSFHLKADHYLLRQ